MMEFRRKPFLKAKSENSAEILNRQKLPYIWSSQVSGENGHFSMGFARKFMGNS